jgi:hypothetical protein
MCKIPVLTHTSATLQKCSEKTSCDGVDVLLHCYTSLLGFHSVHLKHSSMVTHVIAHFASLSIVHSRYSPFLRRDQYIICKPVQAVHPFLFPEVSTLHA